MDTPNQVELTRHQKKYWNNPEHYRAKARARHAANRERSRAVSAAWKAANPEKNRAAVKARRATPYGKARQLLNTAAYVSRRDGRPFNLTHEYLERLLLAALASGAVTCEGNRPDTASIDQIVPSGGYIQGNVQIVPWWYNAAKHDFTAEALHEAMDKWRVANGR
jgi:hypothetical protein